ncbi:GNAT family N-acetyltransferase [Elusimicrobiota bacterium]
MTLPDDVHIRTLRIRDYEDLLQLWNRVGLSCRPQGRDRRDQVAREIRRKRSLFLVAERQERIVGSILATHDGRKGWINRVAVAPESRGQGLAKELVAKAEAWIMERGIEMTACLIEQDNAASIQLFRRLGYEEYGGLVYLRKKRHPGV